VRGFNGIAELMFLDCVGANEGTAGLGAIFPN